MSVSDIISVEMSSADKFSYAVVTEAICSGKIKVYLSAKNTAEAGSRIDSVSEWSGCTGQVSVEKSKLSDITDLYIYVLDEETNVNSTIVKVYYEQFKMIRIILNDDGRMTIFPDRGKNAYQNSSKIICRYDNSAGIENIETILLPESSIEIARFSCWKDTERLTLQMQYYMKNQKADIYGAPSQDIVIYPAPPTVSKVEKDGDKLKFTGNFISGVTVNAKVLKNGAKVLEGKLDENKSITISELSMNNQDNWTVILNYIGPYCSSYEGQPVSVSIPSSKVGIYSVKSGDRVYYALMDKPDEINLGNDIVADIPGISIKAEPYGGTFFSVENGAGKITLTMKKEIFTESQREKIYDDYKMMILHFDGEEDVTHQLEDTVRNRLPMATEDFLFYKYGFSGMNGYTDIYEGMQLFTEYSLYQNIPDADGQQSSYADLSGFTGTGTASYQVVERNNVLTVEPFAESMNFVVEPPGAILGDKKLCPGAGAADLLYTGFARKYMRLVYPAVFTKRNSIGNLDYSRNICLITSDSRKALDTATVNLRREALSVAEVNYHYFRGRSVVVPKISIFINGTAQWVSMGTTLNDIKQSLGILKGDIIVKRQTVKGMVQIHLVDEQISLFAGDSIQVDIDR